MLSTFRVGSPPLLGHRAPRSVAENRPDGIIHKAILKRTLTPVIAMEGPVTHMLTIGINRRMEARPLTKIEAQDGRSNPEIRLLLGGTRNFQL